MEKKAHELIAAQGRPCALCGRSLKYGVEIASQFYGWYCAQTKFPQKKEA